MTISALLSSIPKNNREDALWLLQSRLDCSRSEIFLQPERKLDAAFLRQWKKDWRERLAGKPLQYIVGRAPFYGREFLVSPGVLIPRPETESLVEICLSLFPEKQTVRVLDIGTGSGIIALTLKLERPDWRVTGTDISAKALTLAKKNAHLHGAEVQWLKRDLFATSLQKEAWDLVVSNPPYLDFAKDFIGPDVKKWEPRLALEPTLSTKVREIKERAAWCGEKILRASSNSRVGYTVMELSPRVAQVLEKKWRRSPRVKRIQRPADLAGRKRFLLVAWENA